MYQGTECKFIKMGHEFAFSSLIFSKVIISISILCIEIGLLIKTFTMKKEGKAITKNIGGTIGILLVMII